MSDGVNFEVTGGFSVEELNQFKPGKSSVGLKKKIEKLKCRY